MSFLFAPAVLSIDNSSYQLAEQRNEYWRSVAAYESTVLPVFFYLENIDWEAIISWHIERWQREFVSAGRRFVRENNGRWAGRKFSPSEEPEFDNFTRKVALPIPTPADLLKQSHVFFQRVHTDMSLRDLSAAPDKRRHLAERLSIAALRLTNTSASRNASEWEPHWELQNVLEFRRLHPGTHPPKPDETGALLAKIEHFMHCWATFHEAEQTKAKMSSAPDPLSPPPAPHAFAALLRNYTLADLTALLTDLGLLDTAGCPTQAASPGAWVGVIYGLREAKPARLAGSKSAAHKAFCQIFKAVVSLSAVNTGLGKRDSESEKVRDKVLLLLAQ